MLWLNERPLYGLFVGIDYTTLGLEDQKSHYLIWSDMLGCCCLMNVDMCALIYIDIVISANLEIICM